MNRAVVAELFGQPILLQLATEAEDDSVEGRPPVDPLATAVGLWRRGIQIVSSGLISQFVRTKAASPGGDRGLLKGGRKSFQGRHMSY